eukprot:5867213-Alexandrium_andersonii.AAC.1
MADQDAGARARLSDALRHVGLGVLEVASAHIVEYPCTAPHDQAPQRVDHLDVAVPLQPHDGCRL